MEIYCLFGESVHIPAIQLEISLHLKFYAKPLLVDLLE